MTDTACSDFNDCKHAVPDNGGLVCLYYEDAPGECRPDLCPEALGHSEGGVSPPRRKGAPERERAV